MRLSLISCFVLINIAAFSQTATYYKPVNPDSLKHFFQINNQPRFIYNIDLLKGRGIGAYISLPKLSIRPATPPTDSVYYYVDSLCRLSYITNAGYLRSWGSPYPGDVIVRTPYKPFSVLVDSLNLDSAKINLRAAIAAVSGGGAGYVPASRTLTINGTTYDLSANRSWTIAAGGNYIHQYNGNALSYFGGDTAYHNLSGVNISTFNNNSAFINLASLSASAPLSYNNTTGAFSIPQSNISTNGYLSSTDWNTFNNKQAALGFTAENVANKATSFTTLNNTLYPTTQAVVNYIAGLGYGTGTVTNVSSSNTDIGVATGSTTPVLTLNNINGVTKSYYDVTSSIQTQLNGKQASLGYTAENSANKTATQSSSATTYPNWNGVTTYVTGTFATIANLNTTNTNVAANTSSITTNTANIATNTSNIATNTANIATNTSSISTNTTNIATNTTAIATKQNSLVPTSVKTANYTLAVNDLALFDNTSGNLVATLPTAPADKSIAAVKIVTLGTGNTVTINTAGSDVFNKAGGSTSLVLKLTGHGAFMQYNASTSAWVVLADDIALTQLDARYFQLANNFSDVPNAATARTNLGLGSIATLNIIGNANLSNSTISGVSLGSNLFNQTASTGLTGSTYNGSAAVSWSVDEAYAHNWTNAKTIYSSTPTATANYGVLNIGSGAFDGTTTGFFAGSSSGTQIAVNAANGFGGRLIDAQLGGVSKFVVNSAGQMFIADRLSIGTTASQAALFYMSGNFFSTTAAFSTNGFGFQGAATTYTSTATAGSPSVVGVNTFAQPTLAANNAQAIGDAATLLIANRPAAGTNVTITRGWALRITAGDQYTEGNIIANGKIGIGTGNTAPAASSILDITSTTKGVLIPRMTTSQRTAITLDATNDGLMVYDITLHKFFVNENSTWVQK